VLAALERAGYHTPTPIQNAFVPKALEGVDVIGQAQTGTGKTAAFLLPFLNTCPEKAGAPLGLVLAPTRELVVQVSNEAAKLAPFEGFRTLPIYGGQGFRQQVAQLKRGCHLVVGTPGRVIDHLGRGTLNFDQVRYVVLDEADRMLDIGFRPDIEKILRRCPRERQTLLLSATVPSSVHRLAQRYMVNPVHVNVVPERVTLDAIRQSYITVDEDRKFETLVRLLERENPRQCIIFCERKRWAERLYFQLRHKRQRTAVIHGDLPQELRNRIMLGFRQGKITHLVATDVVGRGIDVRSISHIINYDMPEDPENYVHRIGRTGRIGADGIAISLVTPEQGKQLTQIEAFINRQIDEDTIEGFQTYRPRVRQVKEEIRQPAPVFGRRGKRYSNRL
jgi:ATP-dependent RNA helicase DeaD